MLRNFSFLESPLLAGCALPGSGGQLMEDLEQAREEGITTLVSLTELPLTRAVVEEAGLRYHHLPIDDFGAPTAEQIDRFLEIVDEERRRSGAVLVHCFAGIGRTGTMLAAWLISEGHGLDDAIAEVRRQRPGSVESPDQIDALAEFARRIRQQRR